MVAIDFKSLIKQERERRGSGRESAASLMFDAPSRRRSTRRGQCACCLDKPAYQGCRLLDEADQAQLRADVLDRKAQAQPALDLSEKQVGPLQSVYYVPNFLSLEEEAAIIGCIDAAPNGRWIDAGGRRLQNWGGRPGEATVREELPPFVQALVRTLVAAGVYAADQAPNHCLINDYHGGEGIPSHRDGPLYLPTVATISLGGPALISFHHANQDGSQGHLATQVLLRPSCLLVVSGDAYSSYLHSIASQPVDNITDCCCNASQAGAQVGDMVARAARRVSLVFVHKLGATKS